MSLHKLAESILEGCCYRLSLSFLFSALVVMLVLFSASAEKCDLLNPNACGLYDCGGNSWSPDEAEGNGDNLSLRSGQVNMIGSSKVCMKVHGPGLVRFVWMVDPTAQRVGALTFWVDNAQAAVSNSQGWTPVSYSLREGKDYELAWQFQKTKSYPEGVGAGWIDDLDIECAGYLPIQSSRNWTNESRNETSTGAAYAGTKMTDTSESNGLIFINPPNITINIRLYNSINFSAGIPNPYVNMIPASLEPQSPSECVCQNNSRPECYERISDALDAVGNGGTITIYPGNYNESVIIDKSLRLVGESNITTKIIVQDRDGINISCGGGTVSIENLSIINEYITREKAIGVNVSSENVIFALKNCNITDFSVGTYISKSQRFIILNNTISSSVDLKNKCKNCPRYNKIRESHNFTAGIWFESTCQSDIEVKWNTLVLRDVSKSESYRMHRIGIIHKGIDGACRIDKNRFLGNNNVIDAPCKILTIRSKGEPECSCKRNISC